MCVFVVCLLAYLASLYFLVFLCVVSNSLILLSLFTPFFCEERGGRHGGEATFEGKKGMRKKKNTYTHTYGGGGSKREKKLKLLLVFFFLSTEGLSHHPLPYIWLPLWGKISFGASSRKKKERDMK